MMGGMIEKSYRQKRLGKNGMLTESTVPGSLPATLHVFRAGNVVDGAEKKEKSL